MIIKIIALGKLREMYWQEGVADYARRLQPYARLEIIEIPDVRIPENASPADETKVVAKEGDAIIVRLRKHMGTVVALDRDGKTSDSLELAGWLGKQMMDGQKEIAWIIGGPLGLSQQVISGADLVLSFSRLTFPHQMVRLMLLEQIYRSFRIIHHEPYHK
ncbi:MAG: 23S rRNA (pseudouridine(1915)-N(3))-methyltransferase RlmH [Methanotrichaceae archaeon]